MVRERVGGWRSIWRFALAGLLASALVVATSQTTVAAPLFFALQDQLFPAPTPSPQVTLVALDSAAAASQHFGAYSWTNDIHAKVINYLSREKFRVLKVRAVREDQTKPWVQFPTESALAAYTAARQRFAHPSVFATVATDEP
jgi:CHASE2 domain-containing sensor protein